MKRFTNHPEPWGSFLDMKYWPEIRHPAKYENKEICEILGKRYLGLHRRYDHFLSSSNAFNLSFFRARHVITAKIAMIAPAGPRKSRPRKSITIPPVRDPIAIPRLKQTGLRHEARLMQSGSSSDVTERKKS